MQVDSTIIKSSDDHLQLNNGIQQMLLKVLGLSKLYIYKYYYNYIYVMQVSDYA